MLLGSPNRLGWLAPATKDRVTQSLGFSNFPVVSPYGVPFVGGFGAEREVRTHFNWQYSFPNVSEKYVILVMSGRIAAGELVSDPLLVSGLASCLA